MQGIEGVTDIGFVQPSRQPTVFSEHSAFILASHFDPWPLVIVEAAAAGLLIACTTACGSSDEIDNDRCLVKKFPPGDANALALAMLDIEQQHDVEKVTATLSMSASNYSSHHIANRWVSAISSI